MSQIYVQNSHHLTLKDLPKEAANKTAIFAVCFCFLFAIAPHFFHLPLWISAFVVGALIWRSLENHGVIGPLSKWVLLPLIFLGGTGVFAEYWTIVGRDAGLALLTTMASLKLLECRSYRDLQVLIFLCYFLIATHFLFSQSIATASLMLVTLLTITSTLILINQRDPQISIMSCVKTSARLILMSIPLMLILFVLVPRIPGPLWGLPNEQRGGITGLSDSMSPGSISNLIRNNEVAFRVSFKDEVPKQHQLYWRGPVMAVFDGTRWSQWQRKAAKQLNIRTFDDSTEYTVTLEPNGMPWLLALDIPNQLVENSTLTPDFQLTAKKPVNDLRRYTVQSQLSYQVGYDESEAYLKLTSQYPENQNPKTIALGQKLARQYGTPEEIINHALNLFQTQEYVYTLSPPLLQGDTVDQFLFETKRGFCEHYAGSFALLMRAAGIPSRIVAGYQGGEFNPADNYLIVRQSDAHAWTEVWIENKGWIRIDPTAAVSPDRIELGIDDALPEETSSFRIANRNPIFGNLLFSWDSLQNNWNSWVLNYDQRKQKSFLQKLGLGINDWGDMIFTLVFLLLSITGIYGLLGWYRARPAKPAKIEREFNRLLKKLRKLGLEKAPSEDSRAFFDRVVASNLVETADIELIINHYNSIKYGRNKNQQINMMSINKLISRFQV